MLNHLEFPAGEIDKEYEDVGKIISIWLTPNGDIDEIFERIKKAYEVRSVKINQANFDELKNIIEFGKFPEDSEVFISQRKELLLKYMDIFFGIFGNKKSEVISQTIKQFVALSLNGSDRYKSTAISDDRIFTVEQSASGDITLEIYSRDNTSTIQADLFNDKSMPAKTVSVDSPDSYANLFMYQTPLGLFKTLLEYCYRNNYCPKELDGILDTKGNIPSTSDAKDNYMSTDGFRNQLTGVPKDNVISVSPIGSGLITSHASIGIKTINVWTYGCENKDNSNKSFTIGKKEVGPLLLALMKQPGRSRLDLEKGSLIFLYELQKKRQTVTN